MANMNGSGLNVEQPGETSFGIVRVLTGKRGWGCGFMAGGILLLLIFGALWFLAGWRKDLPAWAGILGWGLPSAWALLGFIMTITADNTLPLSGVLSGGGTVYQGDFRLHARDAKVRFWRTVEANPVQACTGTIDLNVVIAGKGNDIVVTKVSASNAASGRLFCVERRMEPQLTRDDDFWAIRNGQIVQLHGDADMLFECLPLLTQITADAFPQATVRRHLVHQATPSTAASFGLPYGAIGVLVGSAIGAAVESSAQKNAVREFLNGELASKDRSRKLGDFLAEHEWSVELRKQT